MWRTHGFAYRFWRQICFISYIPTWPHPWSPMLQLSSPLLFLLPAPCISLALLTLTSMLHLLEFKSGCTILFSPYLRIIKGFWKTPTNSPFWCLVPQQLRGEITGEALFRAWRWNIQRPIMLVCIKPWLRMVKWFIFHGLRMVLLNQGARTCGGAMRCFEGCFEVRGEK